ncbi:leucyl/phenylalanyl-tRNA--protein transferase [Polymorphobacter multimanifer]|uniref:Leucyl/phenylalanyl-tRNA--protein transferase n=1 Tax=Polymorphobacter multimanifer TaxID=1070431 RepID=A0A841L7B2_9SPHN|nr:leucyl/phenylalanyl-tRNA--protein transferase [Polymorphobacter multimanifer]MBB6228106.1 leucyl/phenylalanyl-tRNA--protein transferase [Polymorphobacter multimanifer]GGI70034.1 leucyl/phenylalanyl-tRNA--protein transferase [Polymorphobacter multimanifer]
MSSRLISQRLDPDVLLTAYASGIFPMAEAADSPDVFWVEPRRRGVLPLDRFHAPRSLLKALRQNRFHFTRDRAFARVLAECAAEQPDRLQTWINPLIAEAYLALHERGHAHSIEAWTADGTLAGGLYGVRLGGAFFGESMFTRVTDGSKAALAALVVRLRAGGFTLLDTQFLTEHLARFGTTEVDRKVYRSALGAALPVSADFGALDGAAGVLAPTTTVSGPLSGHFIAQALIQIS